MPTPEPLPQKTVLMGIVNVTPDSFSDTGKFQSPADAIEYARQLARDGAAILDLGAEATSFFRPGIAPISAEMQLSRLLPVVREWLSFRRDGATFASSISIDTRSARVAAETLAAGAHIINDISAGTHEPEILRVVAQRGGAMILMHISAGYPATPQNDDPDIVATTYAYLEQRLAAARVAGIQEPSIDPGIGFGKTMADNWKLALNLSRFGDLEVPVVLGASRKRFLETPPPESIREEWAACLAAVQNILPTDAHARDAATAALSRLVARRARHRTTVIIHRVHHVTLVRQALTM